MVGQPSTNPNKAFWEAISLVGILLAILLFSVLHLKGWLPGSNSASSALPTPSAAQPAPGAPPSSAAAPAGPPPPIQPSAPGDTPPPDGSGPGPQRKPPGPGGGAGGPAFQPQNADSMTFTTPEGHSATVTLDPAFGPQTVLTSVTQYVPDGQQLQTQIPGVGLSCGIGQGTGLVEPVTPHPTRMFRQPAPGNIMGNVPLSAVPLHTRVTTDPYGERVNGGGQPVSPFGMQQQTRTLSPLQPRHVVSPGRVDAGRAAPSPLFVNPLLDRMQQIVTPGGTAMPLTPGGAHVRPEYVRPEPIAIPLGLKDPIATPLSARVTQAAALAEALRKAANNGKGAKGVGGEREKIEGDGHKRKEKVKPEKERLIVRDPITGELREVDVIGEKPTVKLGDGEPERARGRKEKEVEGEVSPNKQKKKVRIGDKVEPKVKRLSVEGEEPLKARKKEKAGTRGEVEVSSEEEEVIVDGEKVKRKKKKRVKVDNGSGDEGKARNKSRHRAGDADKEKLEKKAKRKDKGGVSDGESEVLTEVDDNGIKQKVRRKKKVNGGDEKARARRGSVGAQREDDGAEGSKRKKKNKAGVEVDDSQDEENGPTRASNKKKTRLRADGQAAEEPESDAVGTGKARQKSRKSQSARSDGPERAKNKKRQGQGLQGDDGIDDDYEGDDDVRQKPRRKQRQQVQPERAQPQMNQPSRPQRQQQDFASWDEYADWVQTQPSRARQRQQGQQYQELAVPALPIRQPQETHASFQERLNNHANDSLRYQEHLRSQEADPEWNGGYAGKQKQKERVGQPEVEEQEVEDGSKGGKKGVKLDDFPGIFGKNKNREGVAEGGNGLVEDQPTGKAMSKKESKRMNAIPTGAEGMETIGGEDDADEAESLDEDEDHLKDAAKEGSKSKKKQRQEGYGLPPTPTDIVERRRQAAEEDGHSADGGAIGDDLGEFPSEQRYRNKQRKGVSGSKGVVKDATEGQNTAAYPPPVFEDNPRPQTNDEGEGSDEEAEESPSPSEDDRKKTHRGKTVRNMKEYNAKKEKEEKAKKDAEFLAYRKKEEVRLDAQRPGVLSEAAKNNLDEMGRLQEKREDAEDSKVWFDSLGIRETATEAEKPSIPRRVEQVDNPKKPGDRMELGKAGGSMKQAEAHHKQQTAQTQQTLATGKDQPAGDPSDGNNVHTESNGNAQSSNDPLPLEAKKGKSDGKNDSQPDPNDTGQAQPVKRKLPRPTNDTNQGSRFQEALPEGTKPTKETKDVEIPLPTTRANRRAELDTLFPDGAAADKTKAAIPTHHKDQREGERNHPTREDLFDELRRDGNMIAQQTNQQNAKNGLEIGEDTLPPDFNSKKGERSKQAAWQQDWGREGASQIALPEDDDDLGNNSAQEETVRDKSTSEKQITSQAIPPPALSKKEPPDARRKKYQERKQNFKKGMVPTLEEAEEVHEESSKSSGSANPMTGKSRQDGSGVQSQANSGSQSITTNPRRGTDDASAASPGISPVSNYRADYMLTKEEIDSISPLSSAPSPKAGQDAVGIRKQPQTTAKKSRANDINGAKQTDQFVLTSKISKAKQQELKVAYERLLEDEGDDHEVYKSWDEFKAAYPHQAEKMLWYYQPRGIDGEERIYTDAKAFERSNIILEGASEEYKEIQASKKAVKSGQGVTEVPQGRQSTTETAQAQLNGSKLDKRGEEIWSQEDGDAVTDVASDDESHKLGKHSAADEKGVPPIPQSIFNKAEMKRAELEGIAQNYHQAPITVNRVEIDAKPSQLSPLTQTRGKEGSGQKGTLEHDGGITGEDGSLDRASLSSTARISTGKSKKQTTPEEEESIARKKREAQEWNDNDKAAGKQAREVFEQKGRDRQNQPNKDTTIEAEEPSKFRDGIGEVKDWPEYAEKQIQRDEADRVSEDNADAPREEEDTSGQSVMVKEIVEGKKQRDLDKKVAEVEAVKRKSMGIPDEMKTGGTGLEKQQSSAEENISSPAGAKGEVKKGTKTTQEPEPVSHVFGHESRKGKKNPAGMTSEERKRRREERRLRQAENLEGNAEDAGGETTAGVTDSEGKKKKNEQRKKKKKSQGDTEREGPTSREDKGQRDKDEGESRYTEQTLRTQPGLSTDKEEGTPQDSPQARQEGVLEVGRDETTAVDDSSDTAVDTPGRTARNDQRAQQHANKDKLQEEMTKEDGVREQTRNRERRKPRQNKSQDISGSISPTSQRKSTPSPIFTNPGPLGPISMLRKTAHVVRHAPIFSFLTMATVTVWIEGTRQLGNMVILSSTSGSAAPTKRAEDPDLEITTDITTDLLKQKTLNPTVMFFLLNLFIFLGVFLTGLFLSLAVGRENGEQRRRTGEPWYKHPTRPFRRAARGLFHGLSPLFMGASIHGPRTILHHSSWKTFVRIFLFTLQGVVTLLLLRQAISFMFLVNNGDSSYSDMPDIEQTKSMSEAAQAISPGTALFPFALLIGISVFALAAGWYALLHPRSSWTSPGGRFANLKAGPKMMQVLKVVGAIVILGTFVGIMVYFGEITTYAMGSDVPMGTYDINLLAANGIIFVFVIPIGWALLVLWDMLGDLRMRIKESALFCA